MIRDCTTAFFSPLLHKLHREKTLRENALLNSNLFLVRSSNICQT